MVPIASLSLEFKNWCQHICTKEAWEDIAKPQFNTWNNHRWNFTTTASDGVWIMNSLHATNLTAAAEMRAKYSFADQQASAEITIALSRLENELRQLNASVGVAQNLNSEAERVVGSLCQIAESLN
jgi:hypothetical protein